MDPNLFHIDWERTAEALTVIVLLAFLIERALALLFESRIFIERFDRSGVKESIALVVAIAVCWAWKFDAMTLILLVDDQMRFGGYIITGAVIAGGSKASIKLFHDVMNIKSTAAEHRYEFQAEHAAKVAETAAAQASQSKDTAKAERLVKQAEQASTRAARVSKVTSNAAVDAAAKRAEVAVNRAKSKLKKSPQETEEQAGQ
jgi:hypothetical protein